MTRKRPQYEHTHHCRACGQDWAHERPGCPWTVRLPVTCEGCMAARVRGLERGRAPAPPVLSKLRTRRKIENG